MRAHLEFSMHPTLVSRRLPCTAVAVAARLRKPAQLALCLALLAASAPALAEQRHWTFIGGCGTLTDWFGKTNGPNAQGQRNCWAGSAGGLSGRPLPTAADDVYIEHSAANDIGNTLALPGRDASWLAQAQSLTVQGLGAGFASLAVASNALTVRELHLGVTGRGAVQQTGGQVLITNAFLGREFGSVGRYELSDGRLRTEGSFEGFIAVGHVGQGQFVQRGGYVGAPLVTIGSTTAGAAVTSWSMTGGTADFTRIGVGFVVTDDRRVEPTAYGRLEVGGTADIGVRELVLAEQGRMRLSGGLLQVNQLLVARQDNFLFSDGTLVFFNSIVTDASRFADLQGQSLPLRFGAGLNAGLPTVRLDPYATLSVPEVQVGSFGRGRLEVLEGAELQSDRAGVGTSAAPLGVRSEALLDGEAAKWTIANRLDLGGGDTATVTVRNGALLETGGLIQVHRGSRLLIEGGGSASTVDLVNDGQVTIAAGGTGTVFRSLLLNPGSQLQVDGVLTLKGWVVLNDGLLGARLSGTGTKVFDGGLELGESAIRTVEDTTGHTEFGYANTLLMDIGGAAPGSFDRYVSDGNLQLGGTLVLMPWAGYVGQAGDTFDLFDGTLSGSFDRIYTDNFTLASGLRWDFSRLDGEGVLGIVATTPVPEPGTWAMGLAGLMVVVNLSRRRGPRT